MFGATRTRVNMVRIDVRTSEADHLCGGTSPVIDCCSSFSRYFVLFVVMRCWKEVTKRFFFCYHVVNEILMFASQPTNTSVPRKLMCTGPAPNLGSRARTLLPEPPGHHTKVVCEPTQSFPVSTKISFKSDSNFGLFERVRVENPQKVLTLG